MNALVPVTALRDLDPDFGRRTMELEHGLTVEEMVDCAMPGLPAGLRGRLRVALITPKGEIVVPEHLWPRVRPNAGVHVLIRLVPGKGALRSILTVLVSIAAVAIANFLAPILFAGLTGTALTVAKSVLTLGLTTLGGLLINALLPPEEPEKEKPAFAISGWRNRFTPGQPVPDPMGRIRFAPPFAAMSYTEVVGDLLYARALFLVGYGRVEISELKLGDTLMSTYDEVSVEIREGSPDDEPQTIYLNQVIEVQQGVDLTRPRPRDNYGNVIPGPSESKPVTRFSATDATGVGILLSMPAGFMTVDKDGDEHPAYMALNIRYRLAGVAEWTDAEPFTLWKKTRDSFFRMIRLEFPVRGRYEIEIERMVEEEEPADSKETWVARCTWAALQSYRPEHPLNFSKPVALVAIRAKATAQLNGQIDTFNCIVEPIRRDFDNSTGAWVQRKTVNPAAYALHVLQGPGNPFPATDDEIDWPALEDWHDFCRVKGLSYSRVHDFDASVGETLAAIGAAGRAAVRHDGVKWTVVIDRPREVVATHLSPRNMRDFRWTASYFRPPDALRVPFLDETADYQGAERLIPWPVDLRFSTQADLAADLAHAAGTEAEVHSDALDLNNGIWVKSGGVGAGSWTKKVLALTEQIELPGITHPDRIFIETRRRQHEIMLRSLRYSGVQAGNIRTATPGDLVMAARDVIRRAVHSARVKWVEGDVVTLDDEIEMPDGDDYAIRFRVFPASGVDYTVVRPIAPVGGASRTVRMTGTGEAPALRSIVHFGPLGSDSIELILAAVERGEEDSSVLHLLPAAPEIDARTDAEIPYPWTGRTGPIIANVSVPAVPRIVSVMTGLAGLGIPAALRAELTPGLGSAVPVALYGIRHRLAGAGVWAGTLTCPAAEASIDIPGYATDDEVELQPKATGFSGIDSEWGDLITVTVGVDDAGLPEVLAGADAEGGMGHALLTWQTGDDENTVAVQIFHNLTGAAFTDADRLGVPVPAEPNTPYERIHGNASNANHFAEGSWSPGTGWSIVGDIATKTPGSTGTISKAGVPVATDFWRFAVDATVAAGSLAARFGGSGGLTGPNSITGSGLLLDRFQPGAGRTTIGFYGDASLDGSIDLATAIAFRELPGSIAQGTHYYGFAPINEDDQLGPISGPIAVVVP